MTVYEVVERGEGQVNATHRPSRTLPKSVKSCVPEIGKVICFRTRLSRAFPKSAKSDVSAIGYVDCF
jgi:hypothetical protein